MDWPDSRHCPQASRTQLTFLLDFDARTMMVRGSDVKPRSPRPLRRISATDSSPSRSRLPGSKCSSASRTCSSSDSIDGRRCERNQGAAVAHRYKVDAAELAQRGAWNDHDHRMIAVAENLCRAHRRDTRRRLPFDEIDDCGADVGVNRREASEGVLGQCHGDGARGASWYLRGLPRRDSEGTGDSRLSGRHFL